MAKKSDFFSVSNVLTTSKGIVVSFIVAIPMYLIMMLMTKFAMVGFGLMIAYMVLYLFAWGYIANKFWRWD